MKSLSIALLFSMAATAYGASQVDSQGQPVLPHCRVSLIEERHVPGLEAGALAKIGVREGQQVKAGEVLGLIDDSKVVAMRAVKVKELEAAVEQAENDVNKRYAAKAAAVADKEHEMMTRANKMAAGAIAAIELEKSRLSAQKAELQIEQADRDMIVARLTSGVKRAELAATDVEQKLRTIISPIDGVVVHVYKHLGEWVPAGEPVVHVVHLDRLRVEGFVNAANFNPSEIAGRTVSVDAELARGEKVRLNGKIVFVNPLVQPGGDYLVWAEVDNKQTDGHWVLRPGVNATMTININARQPLVGQR